MKDLNLSRRSLIESLGSAGIGLAIAGCATPSMAKSTKKAIEPFAANRALDRSAWGNRPKAVFSKTGNFDLSNKYDLNLARTKVQGSLDGGKTYSYLMTRHILCPEGKPPYPLFGEMEINTRWMERDEGMSEEQCYVCSHFTRAAIDPMTFKPIDKYYNPYLDKTIEVSDTLFSGGNKPFNLAADQPANHVTQNDEPHYRLGDDEITFLMFDPRAGEGKFHPRIDTVAWTTSYKDMMNPQTSQVDATQSYHAILKASVYWWSTIEDGDPAQMLTMKTGTKVGSLDQLPREFQDRLVTKYPERM